MKKGSLIIVVTALFFACGSNAENTKATQEVKAVATSHHKETVKESLSVNDLIKSEEKNEEKRTSKNNTVTKPVEIKVEAGAEKELENTIVEPVLEEENISVEVLNAMDARADHITWNTIVKANVTVAGKVNYKEMKASLAKIERYLEHLKINSPTKDWNKNEKLAYWINLYNASTVYLIASNYPTVSITKLNGGKPWDKKFVKSGDKIYSLNQIENEIVRPRFKEPRIHAALNCAAVSCPSLLNEAFTPGKLNAQLDKQTKVWVNDVTKNKLSDSKIKVSQIFDWYAADFKAGGGVVAFINKYATTKVLAKTKVSYLEYDWALNE